MLTVLWMKTPTREENVVEPKIYKEGKLIAEAKCLEEYCGDLKK